MVLYKLSLGHNIGPLGNTVLRQAQAYRGFKPHSIQPQPHPGLDSEVVAEGVCVWCTGIVENGPV